MNSEPSHPESPAVIPQAECLRQWKASPDGMSVSYSGKTYLSQKRVASLGLGLPVHILSQVKSGLLPNGNAADVIHDAQSKAAFFNSDLVDQLQRRFAYADNGESLGRCKVHNGPWPHGIHCGMPRTENHLRDILQVRRDFAGKDNELAKDLSKWLETGTGPSGIRVRTVRDALTGEQLLTFRTLHAINDALRR
jgi:hypothetical protein